MTHDRSQSFSCAQARETAHEEAQEVGHLIGGAVADADTGIAADEAALAAIKVSIAAKTEIKRKMQAAARMSTGVVGYLGESEEAGSKKRKPDAGGVDSSAAEQVRRSTPPWERAPTVSRTHASRRQRPKSPRESAAPSPCRRHPTPL